MSPNVRLSIGDGMVVWVVTQDLAGNLPIGAGTEANKRYVEIDVQSFR